MTGTYTFVALAVHGSATAASRGATTAVTGAVTVAPMLRRAGAMTTTVPEHAIRFERATGTVGAWVRGIGQPVPRVDAAAALRHALHEHGVLFFELDHVVDADEFR